MKKINLSIGLVALLFCVACESKSSNGNSTQTSTEVDPRKTVQLLEQKSLIAVKMCIEFLNL
jgi:hypothetical protein